MLACIVADFFKYKAVQSIIALACWSPADQLSFIRQLSKCDVTATFACDLSILNQVHQYNVEGVLYFQQNDGLLDKVTRHLVPITQVLILGIDDAGLSKKHKSSKDKGIILEVSFVQVNENHFKNHYKWLMVGESLPAMVHGVRYDADMTFLRVDEMQIKIGYSDKETVHLEDIHIHPSEGASLHPWALWTEGAGLMVTQERARILRKKDLKGFPLRIASPMGHYSEDWYNGSYKEYLKDETFKEMDSAIRCGYGASMLVIGALNATDELMPVHLWATTVNNSSMLLKLWYGEADLSGGILRLLHDRMDYLDYVMPIWPFSVGFSYLAERESSSNMFVEPFTAGVWYTAAWPSGWYWLSHRGYLQEVRRRKMVHVMLCSRLFFNKVSSDNDASAVPNGIAGRWTFIVLSICSMLVHAYYTSAIVSALMSSGRSGPDSLRSLADSKYAIASEDYDYMRFLMFDVQTTWDDLEYLKRKKLTSSFYQELERGVDLIRESNTAFHSEYNQIFPHFKKFTDDQICKLQYVDTIPKIMTWITTTRSGQWTNSFRSVSMWIHEVGLAKRLQSRLLALQPPCRSALLAERVNFGDVASLLALAASGVILSLILLGLEILSARWKKSRHHLSGLISDVAITETTII